MRMLRNNRLFLPVADTAKIVGFFDSENQPQDSEERTFFANLPKKYILTGCIIDCDQLTIAEDEKLDELLGFVGLSCR